MNVNLTLPYKLTGGLNPLGIGEGFEQLVLVALKLVSTGLNPLGIGEGFEPKGWTIKNLSVCLNPLGIGEGFEL